MKMNTALPSAAMVITQVALVGSTLAQKKAIATGMHNFQYIFYTSAITSFVLLPLAYFNYRYINFISIFFFFFLHQTCYNDI